MLGHEWGDDGVVEQLSLVGLADGVVLKVANMENRTLVLRGQQRERVVADLRLELLPIDRQPPEALGAAVELADGFVRTGAHPGRVCGLAGPAAEQHRSDELNVER